MTQPQVWDLGKRQLRLSRPPLVMGILNVTPDSFSDGGRYADTDRAVGAGLQMAADGADILDIGGESTRPYSDPVASDEELERVVPVIERLHRELAIPISVDTSKSVVAQAAIAAGAEIVNDVTGLTGDAAMPAIVQAAGVGLCVMHMQGTPGTMQDNPVYGDVVEEVLDFLVARRAFCLRAGIAHEKICLDPGIGFGKTHQHNLALLRATNRFARLGSPLLIGHSRKGFIAHVLGDREIDRDAGTLGVSLAAAAAGAQVLRVHDVPRTVQALKLFAACGGLER